MESWRERGFVPDSDSEDGFDSQETETLNNGVEDTVADPGAAVPVQTEEIALESPDEVQHELQPHASQSNNVDHNRLETPKKNSDDSFVQIEKHEQPTGTSSKVVDEANGPEEPLPGLPEDEETPRASIKTDDSRLPTQSSETTTASAPPTPPAKENDDIWDIPSSEDALHFDHRLSRKPIHVYSRTNRDSEPRQIEDHNISTPSSPLSSLGSLRLDEDGEGGQEQPEEPREDPIEKLLPPLDIPEEILRAMSPPARRSLRERKAIQLHPYMLEDAKYRNMMRARGVKPVRVAQEEAARAAGNESQGKEYVDAAGTLADSFGADFEFPPSSPAEFHHSVERRRPRNSPEPSQSLGSQELGQSPGGLLGRQPKRRKVSKPHDDLRHQSRPLPRPSVVIVNSSPMHRNNAPTFRVPSSPRSEENVTSSPALEPSNVFRFPRGFTPPSITANVVPGQEPKDPEEADSMDWSEAEADDGLDDIQFEASNTRSDAENASEAENDHDEVAVRRYQRRIKGVLPASWLRIDQKRQEERLSATQQRDKVPPRTENAKGVARKITKKSDRETPSGPNAQLTSLRELADPDSGDESEDGNGGETATSHKLLASLGLEDSFNDYGPRDDIPEDNRIDYMFPPVSRATSFTNPRKSGKKRPMTEGNSTRSAQAPKRLRVKRQARLTDPGYGAQKQKRPTPRLPKLGILDAPDVAARPRSEQPQFLRIAARKARSRQDKGRRSPSRKVFNLSSRVDTEDANKSLHEWQIGQIRQTKLPQPQPRPQAKVARRQPLTALSTNRPIVFQERVGRGTSGNRQIDASPAPQAGEISAAGEHASNTGAGQLVKTASISSKPMQPEQRSNKWIVQRNLTISSLTRQDPRPAMLEVTNPRGKPASSSSFQRSLSLLNRDYRRKRLPEVRQGNLVLDRFISSRSSSPAPAGPQHMGMSRSLAKLDNRPPGVQAQARRRQTKKRPPKRLAVNVIQDQQPSVIESTELELHWQPEGLAGSSSVGVLHGFQASYNIELNVTPLCTGTFFQENTFLGSGEFSRSLNILKRDIDRDAGHLSIRVGDKSYRWGAWNDTVSSELGMVFEKMIEWVEGGDAGPAESLENSKKDVCSLYRPVVKYVTDTLSFIDPIDRIGFVRRALSLVCKLNDTLTTSAPKAEREVELLAAICSYNTVFTYQILQIAGHGLVNDTVADEVLESLNRTAKQAITVVLTPLGQATIRRLFAEIDSPETRDTGIPNGHSVVEAYVTVRHILRGTDKLKGRLQEILTEVYSIHNGDLISLTDINKLERVWHCIFTTLPLDELDSSGIARIGSRFWEAHGNWPITRILLRPVLDCYEATSMTQPVSYYKYCRALFHRCFHLINGWGWRDCKPILDTLYDFFAKNTLYNLKHEEGYRSPAFLDELDRNPSLEVQSGDPCFHILLKIIASGLRYLSKIYDKKKTRNFAWRLLPNHGRVYPKEKPIHQEDLDALRNHHDLLCTLYYAVPDGCRPRIETIKNLVNPATSHRETCNISLRSWARLVRFKLSTDEEVSGLEAFAEWHCYFVTELLKQHALARQEVEAQNTADNKFSDQLVERTIAQNQRQIESLLKTALNGLHNAIRSAPTLQHAHKLVLGAPIKALLALFNPRVARVNTTVSDALEVIVAYIQKCNSSPIAESTSAPVAVGEDSQEYGDWADIAAVYDEPPPTAPEVEYVERVFHPAAFRLISNCFGEDYCPEDAILLNVVECWTSIAQTLVKHGLRHWDSYLSPYNGDSWTSLRLTTQTRKFTPLFLASCIEKDSRFIAECKVQAIGMWLSALVERVSMLKYQHRLTEALLNHETMDPLLQNLPFARDRKEGRYVISLEDLSHRRVSLISSLLANMRRHLQVLEDVDARELSSTKQDHREIIQNMMSAMKANYQELGNGAASVQGAYVDFVHRIVGFLQQHSRDICPIDPFFTDPASFPLPSGDPTYIVARLKSYEPKLSSEKIAKTLIMFIQSVSERAAIDGQQDYLVNQLHASMADTYESGLPDKPTLRATLLQAVFPVYLEASFNNPACWILSRPILQTITLVFQDLLFNMDTTDVACIASVLNIFNSVFQASHTVLLNTTNNVTMLKDSAVATSIASFIRMITAALPVIDYIDRGTNMDQRILHQIHCFYHSILYAMSHLDQPSSTTDLYDLPRSTETFDTGHTISSIATNPPFFHELRRSAARELQSYLNESWSRYQKKYYFTRRGGHQPQEIEIQPSVAVELEQSPQQILGPVVQNFLDVIRGLDLLDDLEPEHISGPTFGLPSPDQVSTTDVLYTLDLVDAIGY